jgi:hypothetical protein
MTRIAQRMQALGCKDIRLVAWPEAPAGGDAADFVARDGAADDVRRLLAAAQRWTPPPAAPALTVRERLQEPQPSAVQVREPVLMRLAEVQPEPVRWLWQPYLPLGKLTVLEGDPGTGKTWLALRVAAIISRGDPFPGPDGVPRTQREPAAVVYLTAEDGLADTLRPRLDAAGADVSRVLALTGWQSGEKVGGVTLQDLDVLERALAQVRPALVVVDPLQAYLGREVDMHRANETRPVLAGLAAIAERFSCAVLVVRHLTKVPADRAVYRGLGSIDIAAAARSILLVALDPDDEARVRRVVAHVKSSLAPAGPSLAFELRDGRFLWAGFSEARPEDLLAARDEANAERRKLPQAVAWLRDVLAEGPVPSREIRERAEPELGVSWRTMWSAARELGVRTRRDGRTWVWELPPTAPGPSSVQVCKPYTLAHLAQVEDGPCPGDHPADGPDPEPPDGLCPECGARSAAPGYWGHAVGCRRRYGVTQAHPGG